jgi:hypothetical protein
MQLGFRQAVDEGGVIIHGGSSASQGGPSINKLLPQLKRRSVDPGLP